MKEFDESFKAVLEKFYEPNSVFIKIINSKFKEINIELTRKQKTLLTQQFKSDHINIEINDRQIKRSGFTEEYVQKILDKFFKEIDQYIDQYEVSMERIVEEISQEMSDKISNELFEVSRRSLHKAQKDRNKMHTSFHKEAYKYWKKSFDLLDMTLYITQDIIQSYDFESEVENPNKNLILIKLMSKGCLIFSEIISLIKNGFPDGAYARWRSLHEITVLSEFLSEQSEEIAIKFIDHQIVQDYKLAQKLLKDNKHLFQYEINKKDFEIIEYNYKAIIQKYGKKFKENYGWAYSLFEKEKIYFSDIEASVKFEFVRTHYKMSSDTIHTNSRGLFNYLGLIDNYDFDLLIDSSMIGLEVPIGLAATSISLLNINVLLKVNNEVIMDDLVFMKLFIKIREELVEHCFRHGNELYNIMK